MIALPLPVALRGAPVVLLLALLLWSPPVAAAPHLLQVVDAEGQPTVARVVLTADDETAPPVAVPDDRLRRAPDGRRFFYVEGESHLEIGGPLSVRVYRGFSCTPVDAVLDPGAGSTRIEVRQAFDPRGLGYVSGDGHVHPSYLGTVHESTNGEILRAMRGEDLNLVNALSANALAKHVYWRKRVTGRDEPESLPDFILRVSEEFRSNVYGHLSVYGARHASRVVYTAFANTPYAIDYPLNFVAARRYQLEGAFTSFAHLRNAKNRALEGPADIALGVMHAVEIQGYAVPTREARGIWERLLLAGFDVVLTAGTDAVLGAEVEPVMGGARSFVRLGDTPFTYESFTAALSAGRGFTSSGPLPILQVSGARPGDSIALAPGEVRSLEVTLEVLSVHPWSRVSVRHNGRVALSFESAADGPPRQVFRGEVEVAGPGFLYAEVEGPDPVHSLNPAKLGTLLAVTNPVWLRAGDRVRRDPQSARYFADWIRGDLELLDGRDNFGSPGNRRRVHDRLGSAMRVFEERAGEVPRQDP